METIYLDNVVSKDVRFIMQHSPRVAVDLGVLMFIYGARSWGGRQGAHAFIPDGWTQVPVNWLAERSGLGEATIRDSLERLKKWGMVVERHRENKHQSRVFLYKKHAAATVPKSEVSPEQVAERPPLMEDSEGVFGEVYIWDNATFHMAVAKAGAKEYSEFPVCPECGRVTHPTEGWDTKTDKCSECRIAEVIEEEGPQDTFVTYRGYRKDFTKKEMEKWLNDAAYGRG